MQKMYDLLLENSTLAERFRGDDPPRVALTVRSRAVEGAMEVTVRFFNTDKSDFPATALPAEHRGTIVRLMRPPPGVPQCFRIVDTMDPGSAVTMWQDCVFDEEIDVHAGLAA